jgi:hypothetical protein
LARVRPGRRGNVGESVPGRRVVAGTGCMAGWWAMDTWLLLRDADAAPLDSAPGAQS